MTRLTADTVLAGLLGGSGRIYHALEKITPQVGSLTYYAVGTLPGDVMAKNVEVRDEQYMFNVFLDAYEPVLDRVYRLLHQYRFSTPTDAGIAYCTWDWEGPDRFDEDLVCGTKQVRYKIHVIRQALAPI